MWIVDRSIIIIQKKAPFLNWLQNLPDPEKKITLEELNENPSCYLLPPFEEQKEAEECLEEICEEIVLINNGANVLQGKVRDIKNSYKDNIFNVDFSAPTQVILPEAFEMKQIDEFKIQVKLRENQSRNDLLQILLNQNLEISAFNEILPSRNEIFIRRVGQSNSF